MFDRVTPLFLVLMKKTSSQNVEISKNIDKILPEYKKSFYLVYFADLYQNIGTENQLIHIYFQRLTHNYWGRNKRNWPEHKVFLLSWLEKNVRKMHLPIP